jgi:uncharacterized protein (TIGR02466 family)
MILRRRSADPGVNLSNVGGWQSQNDMRHWGGEAALHLANAAIAMADAVTTLNAAGRRIAWTAEMWANINDSGHSNQTHWHPGSYLSAVYYVDNGYQGSPSQDLGGELVFVDPRMPYVRMRTPDLYHRSADGSTAGQETWLRPAPGLLVMFPSWLGHSVRPYLGTGRRISIAINLVAALAAA